MASKEGGCGRPDVTPYHRDRSPCRRRSEFPAAAPHEKCSKAASGIEPESCAVNGHKLSLGNYCLNQSGMDAVAVGKKTRKRAAVLPLRLRGSSTWRSGVSDAELVGAPTFLFRVLFRAFKIQRQQALENFLVRHVRRVVGPAIGGSNRHVQFLVSVGKPGRCLSARPRSLPGALLSQAKAPRFHTSAQPCAAPVLLRPRSKQ